MLAHFLALTWLFAVYFAGSARGEFDANDTKNLGLDANVNRLKNAHGKFCGIDRDDRLLCWGRNIDKNKPDVLKPKRIGDGRWTQVGVGKSHMCALNKDDMLVYCLGSGSSGQLGDGSPIGELTKLDKLTPIVGGRQFQYLTVGDNHACAIGITQNVFCWGSNDFGQLGNGDNVSSSTPLKVVSDMDSWTTISAGAQHTCGTKNGVEGWCWGQNIYQEVNASPERMVLTPSRVAGSWRGLTAGDGYTLAIDIAGKGFGWGLNELINAKSAHGGVLGDNSSTMCYDPSTQKLCQGADTLAVNAETASRDLENDLTENSLTKTANIVPISGNYVWESISSGGRVPCGIEMGTGRLLCWGYTLGDSAVAGSPQSLGPIPVAGNNASASWVVVSSGIAGSRCGIQKNGMGYCWGLNDFECGDNCPLGDGTRENSPTPVQINGVDNWLAQVTDTNTSEIPQAVINITKPLSDNGNNLPPNDGKERDDEQSGRTSSSNTWSQSHQSAVAALVVMTFAL